MENVEEGYMFESYLWYEKRIIVDGEEVSVVWFFGDKYNLRDIEQLIENNPDLLPTIPNTSNKNSKKENPNVDNVDNE